MLITVASLLMSLLLGVGYLYLLRLWGDRETDFRSMAQATAVGGAISMLSAIVLYKVLRLIGADTFGVFAKSFLITGLFEETAKVLGLFALYPFLKKRLTSAASTVVYISCVALGFSLIENIHYAVDGASGSLLLLRLIICTPMHISFCAFCGWAFYRLTKQIGDPLVLTLSILWAALLHGAYDYSLTASLPFVVLAGVILISKYQMSVLLRMVKKAREPQ